MKKVAFILIFGVLLVFQGCDNPILNPNTSQAISHKMERAEYVEQTKALNRIADVLDRMTNVLEDVTK